MVVRTVDETTCPSEGWLTIGAGQRAIDPTNGCAQIGARGWDSLVQANLASSYRAELDQEASGLEHAGIMVSIR